MDGFISVAELQLFCEEHKGMIGQSALDGQLILDIGDSGRGDAIYENLLDHLTVYDIDDLQRNTGADHKKELYLEEDIKITRITGATLLPVEEAKKLDKEILKVDNPFVRKNTAWWLRSRGKYDNEAACVFDDCGYVGNYFVSCNLGVRPALEINDLKSSDLKIGDKFIFGEHDFTIISDKYALCDDIIGKCAFREDWKNIYNANVYEESDVRKFVDDWFAKEKGITITMQEELEEELDKE